MNSCDKIKSSAEDFNRAFYLFSHDYFSFEGKTTRFTLPSSPCVIITKIVRDFCLPIFRLNGNNWGEA
jgi:hypothetical protein